MTVQVGVKDKVTVIVSSSPVLKLVLGSDVGHRGNGTMMVQF